MQLIKDCASPVGVDARGPDTAGVWNQGTPGGRVNMRAAVCRDLGKPFALEAVNDALAATTPCEGISSTAMIGDAS